ncbi:MAG: hypothetical protein NC203_00355 [Firmicutes bacterium]|nr:hypothetical protein [[Eubacterium] siraeum]MCM1486790.1 hypothetical protein [Bacillota bacterium]
MSDVKGLVTIESFGSEAIDKAELLLRGMPQQLDKAIQASLKRVASAVRTETTKAIGEKFDISAANIRAKQNVKMTYGVQNGAFTVNIRYRGRKIPLFRYNGTFPKYPKKDEGKTVAAVITGQWRMVQPGVEASAHVFKSTSPQRLNDTFVATMPSGHTGIFERTGGVTSTGSDEIKEKMGLSVPQMLWHKEVQDSISKKAEAVFTQRMEHETLRILNGWG